MDNDIDFEVLKKYEELLKTLWETGDELAQLFSSMKLQERVLAGGIALQVKSPFKDNNFSVMLGKKKHLCP